MNTSKIPLTEEIKNEYKSLLFILPKRNEIYPMILDHPVYEYDAFIEINNKLTQLDLTNYENLVQYSSIHYSRIINSCDTLNALIYHVRKQYRLYFIQKLQLSKLISIKEASCLILEAWSTLENIFTDINLNKSLLNKTLTYHRKINNKENENDYVTLYRGSGEKLKYGYSWTSSKEVATFFKQRFNHPNSFVFEIKVPKTLIVQSFETESEYILIPKELKKFNIQKIY